MSSFMYATQKMREAVQFLIWSDKGLRERLTTASTPLHALTGSPIPDAGLQGRLEAILATLANGTNLSQDKASETARTIVDLFEACAKAWGEHGPNS